MSSLREGIAEVLARFDGFNRETARPRYWETRIMPEYRRRADAVVGFLSERSSERS